MINFKKGYYMSEMKCLSDYAGSHYYEYYARAYLCFYNSHKLLYFHLRNMDNVQELFVKDFIQYAFEKDRSIIGVFEYQEKDLEIKFLNEWHGKIHFLNDEKLIFTHQHYGEKVFNFHSYDAMDKWNRKESLNYKVENTTYYITDKINFHRPYWLVESGYMRRFLYFLNDKDVIHVPINYKDELTLQDIYKILHFKDTFYSGCFGTYMIENGVVQLDFRDDRKTSCIFEEHGDVITMEYEDLASRKFFKKSIIL